MKQRCTMTNIYLNWAVYLGGLAWFSVRGEAVEAVGWLVGVPALVWVYLRMFPRISRFLGYGSVEDVGAGDARGTRHAGRGEKVVLYTAAGCPFCPVVEERLRALQRTSGFELEKVDVTLRPDLLREKGIRGVPVVEVGGRAHVGHATTGELADLLAGEANAPGG